MTFSRDFHNIAVHSEGTSHLRLKSSLTERSVVTKAPLGLYYGSHVGALRTSAWEANCSRNLYHSVIHVYQHQTKKEISWKTYFGVFIFQLRTLILHFVFFYDWLL